MTDLRHALRAELTKITTVRSTAWPLLATLVVSVGLGVLAGASFRGALPGGGVANFDPLFVACYGLTLGQIALVVFAVTAVGAEFGTGIIRVSLLAVPRRAVFYGAKVIAAALVVAATAAVTVPATFLASQAALGPHGVALTDAGSLTTVVGAILYLVLIGLFAVGVAAMVRRSAVALALLVPVLFLGSQGLGNVPRVKAVTQYLPDQLGAVMLHLAGPADDPRWARDYGAWTGMALLALWAVAALAGGYALLRRRDA